MDVRQLKQGRVELIVGNIVQQDTDAIVNAANTTLLGGGGVDGAIHRAAGPELLDLCSALPADEKGRRCQTGDVKTTAATGGLKCKLVIHGVGPVYNSRYADKAQQQLRSVHQRALDAASESNCKSVAFPAISTGAYRFPVFTAAKIAIDTACSYLESKPDIQLVRFVLFSQDDYAVFAEALENWNPQ